MADAPRETGPQRAPREVALVYLAVFAGTAALGALRLVPGTDDVSAIGIALLFLGVPIAIARREPEGMRRYGIALGGLLEPTPQDDPRPAGPLGVFDLARALRRAAPQGLRELGFALAVAAIVFPPFAGGFWVWHVHVLGLHPHAFAWPPPDLATVALTQLVVVGLPEEAFFRGYVMTRLHDRWPPRHRILGADLHLGVLVASSALFALVHLATEPRQVEKLATFFPGLLFGWMRARRGGIGAAMTMHALSNLLAETLTHGWLR